MASVRARARGDRQRTYAFFGRPRSYESRLARFNPRTVCAGSAATGDASLQQLANFTQIAEWVQSR